LRENGAAMTALPVHHDLAVLTSKIELGGISVVKV
jgi:hypothetical protein